MKPAPKEPKASSQSKRKKSNVKGSRLEAFNFLSIVGSGAFGKVFKAELLATKEIVAVKQILEDEHMMNRETQILGMIKNHRALLHL